MGHALHPRTHCPRRIRVRRRSRLAHPRAAIADAWNDFVEKIGAPQEAMLNAAEIHYLRDAQYVSARLALERGSTANLDDPRRLRPRAGWKVANGSRALEAIRLVWLLANNTDDFPGIHAQVQKGVLVSDLFPHPEKPPAPATGSSACWRRDRTANSRPTSGLPLYARPRRPRPQPRHRRPAQGAPRRLAADGVRPTAR